MATISKIKLPDGITYDVQDVTSGYIKTETDPTVPSWAKASSKPSYSASEISGLGTAATKNVPSSGNASSTQVVLGSDTRLTNSRPSSDVVQTYSATSTVPISGKGVAAALATLPTPMVFKGTLGTGGTITSLPTNGTASIGDTYKVITAGTYASQAAKVGDVFICQTKTSSANTWAYVPSGDETDSDTWRNIKVNGTEKLGTGISSGAVDFVNGTNTTVAFDSSGNKVKVNVPNISTTSVGSASAGTAIAADDITAWTTNTPTAVTPKTVVTAVTPATVVTSASGATATVSGCTLTITNGSFGTGSAASVTTGDSCSVTAGTAASLSYTARSIPNISVSSKTVATGFATS